MASETLNSGRGPAGEMVSMTTMRLSGPPFQVVPLDPGWTVEVACLRSTRAVLGTVSHVPFHKGSQTRVLPTHSFDFGPEVREGLQGYVAPGAWVPRYSTDSGQDDNLVLVILVGLAGRCLPIRVVPESSIVQVGQLVLLTSHRGHGGGTAGMTGGTPPAVSALLARTGACCARSS
jgi:hypothetical protein